MTPSRRSNTSQGSNIVTSSKGWLVSDLYGRGDLLRPVPEADGSISLLLAECPGE
jgi:hypothetical protein